MFWKSPKTLFKYFPAGRVDSILGERYIRLTPPHAFNDPFDVYPYVSLGSDADIRKKVKENINAEYASEAERLRPYLGQKDRLGAEAYAFFNFSDKEETKARIDFETKLLKHQLIEMQENLRSKVLSQLGILSLTEICDSILMWSHYASNHSGFVLEFNTRHPFFSPTETEGERFGPVQYSSKRPGFRLDNELDSEPLFVKSLDWQYEREWRLIKKLKTADKITKNKLEDICLFKLPCEAVQRVILGATMPEETRKHVQSLIEENSDFENVKIIRARMHATEYRIEFREDDLFERMEFFTF